MSHIDFGNAASSPHDAAISFIVVSLSVFFFLHKSQEVWFLLFSHYLHLIGRCGEHTNLLSSSMTFSHKRCKRQGVAGNIAHP